MRVLIVDDNANKIRLLVDRLTAHCSLDRDRDIIVSQCAFEARKVLKKEPVDLLILDIVLPMRPEDEPSKATALALLDDLTARNTMIRPKQIVGLTAYEDVAKEVSPHFAGRLWTVISFDQSSDEWLRRIEGCVSYLKDAQAEVPIKYGTDLCIVTALADPEAAAIHRLPWSWQPLQPMDDTAFVKRGHFLSNGNSYSAASVVATRMGMVETALISSKAIERLRPRFLVMAGILAGVKSKVNFGDVILADPSWDYQSGKRSRDRDNAQFSIDPHQISVSAFIRARAEEIRDDHSALDAIKRGWPTPPATELKLVVGPVASGSAVLADGEVVSEIREQQRKLLGVEMETYGLYAAALRSGSPKPTALSLKAVCDFADSEKSDAMQSYASYTSANVLRLFFERHMSAIYQLAGT